MFTIGILGEKGGPTTGISLAVEFVRAGEAAALLDIGPQAKRC
jgi:hypothetical protein